MRRIREQKKMATHPNESGLWARAQRSWRWLWTETEAPKSIVVHAPADVTPAKEADILKSEKSETLASLLPFKSIAWLGASAGGLTILLVVIGFLALSAHDAMLGIPRSIQNNPEYVAVGGLFFGRSIIFLVTSFIFLKSWIGLGAVVVGSFVFFISRRRSRLRSLAIVVFSIVLLGAEIYALTQLTRPLQISNLLLGVSVDANSSAKQVVDALLVKDTTWLSAEYGFLFLLVVASTTAFFVIEQSRRPPFWQVVRVPAFILLLICVFLLPRAYGVLTISNDYPTVVLESSSPSSSAPASETRLLLSEDDKVLVLYDPSSRSITTVNRGSVAQHKAYAPQHVFTVR